MNRDDLTGLANWDSHRECYVPEPGKEREVGALLGDDWEFDSYYGAYFSPRECKLPVVPDEVSGQELPHPDSPNVNAVPSACLRDDAEARARHLAREPFVVPFGTDEFPGSPWQSAVFSLPVGKPEDVEGTTDYALFALQNGVLALWLREDLRHSPYIHFYDASPVAGVFPWLQPMIGGIGWHGDTSGWELRCAFDAEGALHLALPTYPELDPLIVWWRLQTADEWLGSPDEYEQYVFPYRGRHLHPPVALAEPGWEFATDYRTLTRYYRRKRR